MKFLPLTRLWGKCAMAAGAFLFLLIALLFPLFAQEAKADFEFLPSLAAEHSGAYIVEPVSFPPVSPLIDGNELSDASPEWQFGFLFPPDEEVPATQGVYALFRGTFGDVEGGTLVSGENYVLVQAAIPAGVGGDDPTATTTVSLPLNTLFGDPDTLSGSYTLVAARLPTEKCIYNEEFNDYDCEPYTTDDFLALFAGGSDAEDTFSPDQFWSIPFDYVAGGEEPGCQTECFSNVLFLPGIKGSRLYRAADSCGSVDFSACAEEEKLWEPGILDVFGSGNDQVRDLFLDTSGKSIRGDIYVKTSDIIDSAGGGDYYKSFMEDMDALVDEETIVDWEPISYDWRLSLDDVLAQGAEVNGRISYTTATDTPYIAQELRRLAASSKSGKVTIIAHSNGGLLAKELLRQLGDEEAAELVDKLILVGVPQSGAPRALGALLYGYEEEIEPIPFLTIVSKDVAREFAENSSMAYHLLPSSAYFDDLNDPDHPVALFSGTEGYAKEIATYGDTLDSAAELKNFALAADGGRAKPDADNLREANVLNSTLLDYASQTHESLDNWTPPDDITVYQIAGWGLNTVAGIEFRDLSNSLLSFGKQRLHRPIIFKDGDGVVPSDSALLMDSARKYWLNLEKYKKDNKRREHPDILEIPQIRLLIKNVLKDESTPLPEFVVDSEPSPSDEKRFGIFLYSPLTLGIKDDNGNYTGLNEDGSITNGIDGVEYGQFGEVQYLIVPKGSQYTLTLNGLSSGTFTLDIQEMTGDAVIASTTLANVPITENTLATLKITDSITTVTPLSIDSDGDGDEDFSIEPQAGEIVFYVEEQKEDDTEIQSSLETAGGGGGGGIVGSSPLSYGFVATTTASSATSTTTDSSPSMGSTHSTSSGQANSPQANTASSTEVELVAATTTATSTDLQTVPEEDSINAPEIEINLQEPEPVGEVQGAMTTDETPPETQTASAFNAVSQQSWLSKFTKSIYNLGKLLFTRIYSLIKRE